MWGINGGDVRWVVNTLHKYTKKCASHHVLNGIHKREAHPSKTFQKNHPMHSSEDVTYPNSCFNRCPPNANYNLDISITNKVKQWKREWDGKLFSNSSTLSWLWDLMNPNTPKWFSHFGSWNLVMLWIYKIKL
jgi:hypothetical protein